MRNTFAVVGIVVAVGSLLVSACGPGRQPVKTVASAATGANCTAQVETANVSNWREVQSEGLTFCVPQNWRVDTDFERVQGGKMNPQFRMLSWAAPDSTERIVIDIPTSGRVERRIKYEISRCAPPQAVKIGEQIGCRSYWADTVGFSAPSQSIPGSFPIRTVAPAFSVGHPPLSPTLRIVLAEPLAAIRAIGSADAWIVLETIRPLGKASGF